MFKVYVISKVTFFNYHGAPLYINILGGAKVWVVRSSVDGEGGLTREACVGVHLV